MLKIYIVDDTSSDVDVLKHNLISFFEEKGRELEIIHFDNAISFFENYDEQADIVFFDIDLPGMNGIDAARKLRSMNEYVKIIFVTNFPQFAIDGYGINALDFMVKPISPEVFRLKMERIGDKLKMPKIKVKYRGDIKVINSEEILYADIYGHNLTIYLSMGEKYSYRGSMKDLEDLLREFGFARCNACYLINLKYLTKIEKEDAYIGDIQLKISRQKKKDFIETVQKYLHNY